MAKPANSIAINGAKFFIFKDSKGQWVGDPLVRQAIYSRTFIPIGREYKMTDEKATMLSILRTDKVPLKEEQLSEETKAELEKAKIPYTPIEIKPVDPKIISK